MAITIPIITELADKGIKDAKKLFGDLKTAVSNAEGGMGKFKSGSKVAMDAVSANAGTFAIAGAAAFAGFAKGAIDAFQDIALEVGKFSDVTGLTLEDASRWKEFAGDVGIEVGSLETTFNKLNIAVAKDPKKFENLGIDLKRTADGALDVNDAFLKTIIRIRNIKDPAEKARVATELLGKGWKDVAEIINMSTADITANLEGVEAGKIISEEDLARAKEYRDTMDKLAGYWESFTISFGGYFVEQINGLSRAFEGDFGKLFDNSAVGIFADQIGKIGGVIGSVFTDDREPLITDQEVENMRDMGTGFDDFNRAALNSIIYKGTVFKPSIDQAQVFRDALKRIDDQWKRLSDSLNAGIQVDKLNQDFKTLEEAAKKAFGSGSQQDVLDYKQKYKDVIDQLALVASGLDNISSRDIKILVDTGQLEKAVALANYFKSGAEYGKVGLTPEQLLTMAGITTGTTSGRRAAGGPVGAGRSYLVGERGPEIFTPGVSGGITPNSALGGGGANVTINVSGGDPNAVVAALRSYMQRNGSVPIRVSN